MFDNWNSEEKCFIFQCFKLNFIKIDVALILSLPNYGELIPVHIDIASNQLYSQHFKVCDYTKELEKLIKNSKSQQNPRADKLYCQLFILYFLYVFFFITSSILRLYIISLIDCVDDLAKLIRYNWCDEMYNYMASQMELIVMIISL